MKLLQPFLLTIALFSCATLAMSTPVPGAWARYDLLSTIEQKAPPLEKITLTAGPRQDSMRWWEMTCVKPSGTAFCIRVLSASLPMTGRPIGAVRRYILREGSDQPIQYVDSRTGMAFLPKFQFATQLCPVALRWAEQDEGLAATGTLLGQVISLSAAGTGARWDPWPKPLVLRFNPDLMEYMSRLVKDTEGHYITQGDYTYLPLTQADIRQLAAAGLNSLSVQGKYEQWVYRLPILYYKQFSAGDEMNYPQVLYRSNFRGSVPFIDEPAIHLLGDPQDLAKIKRPEDGALLLRERVRQFRTQESPGEPRRGLLRQQLLARGANPGTMALDDNDSPIWETIIETAEFQLQGGGAGIIHEGRFQLKDYIQDCERFMGKGLNLSVDEMLRLDYAWMRGAARATGKSWGVSIYGQCDPRIAPRAIDLAYDMGARYVWFWTTDHQHHLPQFMKLRLLRQLSQYSAKHPRPAITKLLYHARTAVVLPYGYGWTPSFYQMWESPALNILKHNRAAVPYRAVMAQALAQAIIAMRAGGDVDFVFDTGAKLAGYTRIIRIGPDGQVKGLAAPRRIATLRLLHASAFLPAFAKGSAGVWRIPYLASAKVVNDPAQWPGDAWQRVFRLDQYAGAGWEGASDLSAELALGRDARNLYVAARVTDDKQDEHYLGDDLWRGDSIQIAMDPTGTGGRGYSSEDMEFGLALGPHGPEGFIWKAGGRAEGGPLTNASIRIWRSGNQTFYRAAIPWRTLSPIPFALVENCRASFVINDSDGAGLKGRLRLTPGIVGTKDPGSFMPARMQALPQEETPPFAAFMDADPRTANDLRRWAVSFDTISRRATRARVTVELIQGGHKTAAVSFMMDVAAGRSRAQATLDASALRPGGYICRFTVSAPGQVVEEFQRRVYLLP